jgi:UDP-N-acetylmuramate: L-alanyl-gamma-D-glutamyl-meso-diaminopimelate ligase
MRRLLWGQALPLESALMHIHVVGICGTFMGSLALLARSAGHRVTGCDAQVYPPMSTQLVEAGIELIEGYSSEQLALVPDVWVIGNVISRGNPLIEAILNAGLPYTSGPQWVSEHILQGRWVLAVAGTHGKTTTASMLAWILEACDYEPSFLIGGVPHNFGVSARLTASNFFVIEADEYDTAFFDKRSKFVHYRARTVVLNNLEFDHADIFPDLAAIETQFHHLVRTVPADGLIVVNGTDEALARVLARGTYTPVEDFGGGNSTWREAGDRSGVFSIAHGSGAPATLEWSLLGRHNRQNALAAIAAARHVGVRTSDAIDALRSFKSVKRRMELRGTVAGITVYDDFAHHPSAILTTLEGLRASLPQGERILAVLEPRSNTMKLGVMAARLAGSLACADLIFGYGATTGRDALGWDLAAALAPLGERAFVHTSIDGLILAITQAARAGDHVVIMSNGGFGGIHGRLLKALTLAHRRD